MAPSTLETEPLLQKDDKEPNNSTYKIAIATILLLTPIYLVLAYVSIPNELGFIFIMFDYMLLLPGLLLLVRAWTLKTADPYLARLFLKVSSAVFYICLIIFQLACSEWWKKTGWDAVRFWAVLVFWAALALPFLFITWGHVESEVLAKDDDGSVHELLPPEKMV